MASDIQATQHANCLTSIGVIIIKMGRYYDSLIFITETPYLESLCIEPRTSTIMVSTEFFRRIPVTKQWVNAIEPILKNFVLILTLFVGAVSSQCVFCNNESWVIFMTTYETILLENLEGVKHIHDLNKSDHTEIAERFTWCEGSLHHSITVFINNVTTFNNGAKCEMERRTCQPIYLHWMIERSWKIAFTFNCLFR